MKIIFLDPIQERGQVCERCEKMQSAPLAQGQVFRNCGDMYGSASLTSEIALRTFKCL